MHSAKARKADWIRYRGYEVRSTSITYRYLNKDPFLATSPGGYLSQGSRRQLRLRKLERYRQDHLSDSHNASSNRFWPPCLRRYLADRRLPAPIPRRQPLGKFAPSAASRLRQQLALSSTALLTHATSATVNPTSCDIPTPATVVLVASPKSVANTRLSRRNLWHQAAAADPTTRHHDSFPPQCRY